MHWLKGAGMADDPQHPVPHPDLVGYLLDDLSPDERQGFEEHMASCPACRGAVGDLASVTDALSGAGPAFSVPADLEDRVLEAVDRDTGRSDPVPDLGDRREHARGGWTSRLRRRLPAVAAAAAAIVAAVIGVILVLPEPSAPEVAREPVVFEQVQAGLDADASLIAHTWGTELILFVSGLPDGQVYEVTFEGQQGGAVPAGTFIGIGGGPITCNLTAAVLREDLASFTVATASGEVILRADLPPV